MALAAAEQYELELINRARLDPEAEAARYGISLNQGLAPGTISSDAMQVLAPNEDLEGAAQSHSEWMLANDVFSHSGGGGSSAGDRMAAAGYQFAGSWGWAENLGLMLSTTAVDLEAAIEQHHQSLFLSTSHRVNTMDADMSEIGIAQVAGEFTQNGTTYNASMLTEKFAYSGTTVFVTGVAYDDRDNDAFYGIGEGLSGIIVTAAGIRDVSEAAGGYSVGVAPSRAVSVSVGDATATLATLTMDVSLGNGKLDLVRGADDLWRLELSASATLVSGVANATLLGVGDLNLTGHAGNNVLTGNKGDNTLSGAAGNDRLLGGAGADFLSAGSGMDTMFGGTGNDTYATDGGDAISENANEGIDTVQSSASFTLGAHLENLVLTGTLSIDAIGNVLANRLTGNDGRNSLAGTGGSDTLIGGDGDDIYITDGGDTIIENPNEGNDTVQSSVSYTLGANLENLTLTGSAAINGKGNTAANVLIGNSAANALSGAGGADTLIGGGGNDIYTIDGGDTVTENANQGIDTVQSSASFTLGPNLENLTLTGSAVINGTGNTLANRLTGNTAANTLNGAGGADTMLGGAGDDLYISDGSDTVTENANQGTDTVQASANFTLGANIEHLTLTGSAAISGKGNTGANRLTGNGADNALSGAGGADTLLGGAGNDIYTIDGGDTVIENANEGTDTVQSSATFTLGANLERLSLTGSANINGTGNAQANTINGNTAANTLDGAAGNDTLTGGAGSDTFVFSTALGATNIDQITDFNSVADTIRLENAVFTGLAAGTLSATAFVRNMSGDAADANDRILYEIDTGRLFFDADGTGAGAKVHFATIGVNITLTNADFFAF